MLALYFYFVRIVRTNLSRNGIRMNYDCVPVPLFFSTWENALEPQEGGTFTLHQMEN